MNCVVTSSGLTQLLDCLGRMSVPFQDLPPGQTSVNALADGYPVLVGEVNDLAYLVEDGGTAFGMCWGILARVARDLEALVIGTVYSASEDHCEFFAARGPQIVRAFWSNPRRTTRPYSQGTLLASEAATPLSTGDGIAAAMRDFRFPLWNDEERDLLPGERWVLWPGDLATLLESDELRERVNDHVRANPNPTYQPPVPKVRVRRIEQD